MKSIRLFLTISIISTVVLANFVAAIHGYQESMKEAEELFDQKLVSFSRLLSKTTQFMPLSNDASKQTSNDPKISDDEIQYQVRDKNGKLLLHSSQLGEPFDFELQEGPGYLNFQHSRWRFLTFYSNKESHWGLVMEKQDIRYKLVESVIIKSVYPIIMAIPIIILIIFLIVRQGLNPIINLARNVDQKRASELSPIQLQNIPKELNSLTERINELLGRLDNSLRREKRFSSDAAHELRTPIAALNIQMKNLLDLFQDEEDGNKLSGRSKDKKRAIQLSELFQDLEDGVKRMSHLVEQILTLSRSTPEYYSGQFQVVDLNKLLTELVVQNYSLIEKHQHEIELDCVDKGKGKTPSNYLVRGDLFGLQTLFKNLLFNSIKYTPIIGCIKILLESSEDAITVQIMDSGPGIVLKQRERVFERFYRLDGDRNQSSILGCGLGLAIVKQIADLHSVNLSLDDSQFTMNSGIKVKMGLCVKLVFPKNNTPSGAI